MLALIHPGQVSPTDPSSSVNNPPMTPELSIQAPIATLTLRRPAQANRLEPDDLQTLAAHLDTVNQNHDVRVLRLTATGSYFCSGFDIGQIGAARHVQAPVSFESLVDAMENARPVTVAVIQGGVYGGATDLALACDFRVGSRQIDMFMPAARLGLHYYRSGLERYVQRLGLNAAKRLFLTAERLDAQAMYDMGFLTHLCQASELTVSADALVNTLAQMAPLALLGMKKHLNQVARQALDTASLSAAIAACAQSADLREGAAAFAQRRAPRFNGN